MKKGITTLMCAVILSVTLHSNKARAVDPYAALASATIAAYVAIGLAAVAVVAGGIWTTVHFARKEVILKEAQEDALAFLANESQDPSPLLKTIFEKTREEMGESADEITDTFLAEGLIKNVTIEMM